MCLINLVKLHHVCFSCTHIFAEVSKVTKQQPVKFLFTSYVVTTAKNVIAVRIKLVDWIIVYLKKKIRISNNQCAGFVCRKFHLLIRPP